MIESPSTIDPVVLATVESFYRAADSESTVDVWANHFTPNGIAKKSPDEVKGRENLQNWIASSWATVESREHVVHKVFPFGDGTEEVMLYGSTHSNLKDGGKRTLIWTGRLKFVKTEGKYLINRYTVVLDPTPPTEEMLSE